MSQRISFNKWPLWAKVLAKLSNEKDTGLGDTIARTIGPIGGDAYKKWFLVIFGENCGCDKRQEEWNAIYKY